MSEWVSSHLGEHVTHKKGFAFKSKDMVEAGHPIVRVANFTQRSVEMSQCGFLRPELAAQYGGVALNEGDVVIATVGSWPTNPASVVGKTIAIPAEAAGALLNQNAVRLRAQHGLEQRFMFFRLKAPDFQDFLIGTAQGSANQASIKLTDIFRFPISVPSIAEQKRISSCLGAFEDKIELNRQMNETLEEMARALFRDWFVDFGPTRRKAEGETDPVTILGQAIPSPEKATPIAALFPDALGEDGLPVGWKQGLLDDWASAIANTVKPNEVDQETHYIGLEHMPRRSIALGQWETAAKVTSNKSAFERGQILFGKLRPYFHKVGIAPLDGICSTDIVVVDGLSPELRAFVATLMSTDDFVSYTNQSSSGTKMPRTSWKLMREYPVARADKELVFEFSTLVQPMHDKILQSLSENQTLAQMRDLLLPKLMSGEIRLKEAADG